MAYNAAGRLDQNQCVNIGQHYVEQMMTEPQHAQLDSTRQYIPESFQNQYRTGHALTSHHALEEIKRFQQQPQQTEWSLRCLDGYTSQMLGGPFLGQDSTASRGSFQYSERMPSFSSTEDLARGPFAGISSTSSLLSELILELDLPLISPWPPLSISPTHWSVITTITPSLPLPPRHVASTMLDMYHRVFSPSSCLFSQAELSGMINAVYLNKNIVRRDIADITLNSFVVVMTTALGILSRQEPSLADMSRNFLYFARCGLSDQIHRPSIKGLKFLLASIQVNSTIETDDPIWYAASAVLQMSVEMGLHLSNPTSQEETSEEETADEEERRRVFWSAYSIDRGLTLIYGRPTTYPESAITCPYPVGIHPDIIARFKIRRIQSSILRYCLSSGLQEDVARPFPDQAEEGFLHDVKMWLAESNGTKEQIAQAGSTELFIYRRGLSLKNRYTIELSLQIVHRNLAIYQTEILQSAIVDGIMAIHDLFVTFATLLYIYTFGNWADLGLNVHQIKVIWNQFRPIFGELARRWTFAARCLEVIDMVATKLCSNR